MDEGAIPHIIQAHRAAAVQQKFQDLQLPFRQDSPAGTAQTSEQRRGEFAEQGPQVVGDDGRGDGVAPPGHRGQGEPQERREFVSVPPGLVQRRHVFVLALVVVSRWTG